MHHKPERRVLVKSFTWCLLFFACYLQAQSYTVTADFTNRSGGPPIPGPMAGWNGHNVNLGGGGATIGGQIQDAQLWNQRYVLDLSDYCTASVCGPSYTRLDKDLNEVYRDVGTNARVTITIVGTPTGLARDLACGNRGVPSDVTMWGKLAAQLVHYIDQQNYSGIVEAYEIENEPDIGGICWPSWYTEQQQQLHDYKSIYAAAAPQIKKQLSSDGKSALVGGPAICCQDNAAGWLSTGYGTESAFLQDAATASYVDFVSAHHYSYRSSNWGKELDYEQGPRFRNFANDVYGYIHAGLQPNASSTPLWINEYDTAVGRVFVKSHNRPDDACRFAPCNGLFQGLFIADQIASVYDSNHGMARTWMYDINASNHCIFGTATGDTENCVSSSFPPMPNYYAFKLINGTLADGLDLGSGGNALQQYSSGQPSDTVTAGWYNGSGNHFFIVNPGANSYTITFVFKNTGYVSWTGAGTHLWDSVNGPTTITTNSITMTKSNASDWTASAITVPPYSILGVGFRGQ
jgi:hypothetical protein